MSYLISDGLLADKDKEDEEAPEKIDTSNDPVEQLSVGATIHVPVITMDKIVDTFKYPEYTHHCEQLAEQHLE